jgi:hypothetical protein
LRSPQHLWLSLAKFANFAAANLWEGHGFSRAEESLS